MYMCQYRAPQSCVDAALKSLLNNSEANTSQQEVHFLCAECFVYKNEREVPLRQPSLCETRREKQGVDLTERTICSLLTF